MKKVNNLLLVLALLLTLYNCDNDDGNAPNQNTCVFQGLTYEDANQVVQTQIPENQLQTNYFPNNDGPGLAAVEVFETTNPGANFIVTRALIVGAIDNNPQIVINNVSYTGVVTCQLANNTVGNELRFDIVLTIGGEAELCVIIDNVIP